MSDIRISTAHNGVHRDFYIFDDGSNELAELEEYLDTFDYYESGTLMEAVENAIKGKLSYIVEPVNGDEDLSIDFYVV